MPGLCKVGEGAGHATLAADRRGRNGVARGGGLNTFEFFEKRKELLVHGDCTAATGNIKVNHVLVVGHFTASVSGVVYLGIIFPSPRNGDFIKLAAGYPGP